MQFPGEEYKASVVLPHKFNAIRAFGGQLHSTSFELKIQCTPTDAEKRTLMLVEEKAHEAMQRLNFWWDTILTDCIMIDTSSEIFPDILGAVENTSMFCPGLPTDHLLVELLHAKLSAITKGMFDVHAISLTSSDTNYAETSYRKMDGYSLPGIEYFPDEALHKVPWWERDTIEVCEFAKGSILEDELYNHFSDFFGQEKEADIIIFRQEDDED